MRFIARTFIPACTIRIFAFRIGAFFARFGTLVCVVTGAFISAGAFGIVAVRIMALCAGFKSCVFGTLMCFITRTFIAAGAVRVFTFRIGTFCHFYFLLHLKLITIIYLYPVYVFVKPFFIFFTEKILLDK